MKRLVIGGAIGAVAVIIATSTYAVSNRETPPKQSQQATPASSSQEDEMDANSSQPQVPSSPEPNSTSSTTRVNTGSSANSSSSSTVNIQSHATNGQTSTSVAIGIDSASFSNTSITVQSGAIITWTNNDAVAHTVTADGGSPEAFDSGQIAPGNSYTRTFNTLGTYSYHCTSHPNMKGTITITN